MSYLKPGQLSAELRATVCTERQLWSRLSKKQQLTAEIVVTTNYISK